MKNDIKSLITKKSTDYELIDSGEAEKLERFGGFILRRPDPQALWNKNLESGVWDKFNARFVASGRSGSWKKGKDFPETWNIGLSGIKFLLSLSSFKHTGIFPEQSENWRWIEETVKKAGGQISVLNLFGYTGGATLAAAKAGAAVCHVDGSKTSINRAAENAKLSGLDSKPIRWIVDDVLSFVKREFRRGNYYDAIIMDPPAYGHGPDREVWQIEKHLPELITECRKILSPDPIFVLMNGYASGYSAVAYKNNLSDLLGNRPVSIEHGELLIEGGNNRLLPSGIFARWRKGV